MKNSINAMMFYRSIVFFKDIHTHFDYSPDAIINFDPVTDNFEFRPHRYYSVGIHPWNSGVYNDDHIRTLGVRCIPNQVVAIGETGVDKLRGAPVKEQIWLFRQHILLSEALHKPLIIHCVKSYDVMISLHREYNPTQLWIIHGFRGKNELALQLRKEGFALSINYAHEDVYQRVYEADPFPYFRETDTIPLKKGFKL